MDPIHDYFIIEFFAYAKDGKWSYVIIIFFTVPGIYDNPQYPSHINPAYICIYIYHKSDTTFRTHSHPHTEKKTVH